MTYYGGKDLAQAFLTVRNNTIQVAKDIPEVVDDDGTRVRPFDATHGQARIVGQHRIDADQDGVVHRAQAVREVEREVTTDAQLLAGATRDRSIEALRIGQRDARPLRRDVGKAHAIDDRHHIGGDALEIVIARCNPHVDTLHHRSTRTPVHRRGAQNR